jgi:membrane protease YdiL (CAAX protease family)
MTVEPSPASKKSLLTAVPARLGFLWLISLFLLGVGMRFVPRDTPVDEPLMLLPERMALMAKFGPDLSPTVRAQLLAAAQQAETESPDRARVLEAKPLSDQAMKALPSGYRLMAQYQKEPDPETKLALERMAAEAQHRLTLCLAMLGSLVLAALATSFLAQTERKRPALSMASLSPMAFLALFMVWDVGNVFGIGLVLEGLNLRTVLSPLGLILGAQLAGYGLMLLLFKAARPVGGPWNLSFAFPWAWVGRGYFACYALVFLVNLLLATATGEAPTSSNPLLGMFMESARWQVAVLALLVVVVGPAFEELIFRGWLLGGLRERWGDGRAIAVSSALFAVIHGDPWATPALFCLGCVFGWVYLRSGSLYASIVLHAMWNATTFTILLANMP